MTPYSQDLRKRILDTVQRGDGSLRQIARRFLVSVSFVTRLLRTHRSTGSLEPKPHGGGNPAALGPEDLERLRELIRQQPDATLEECRQRLRLVQHHDHLARPAQAGAPTQKEGPVRRGAGPPGGPGATEGIPRGAGRPGPATADLHRRVRGQYGDDPEPWPRPGRTARLHQYPRPMGVDQADLRTAPVRGHGTVGLPGCHQHRHLRGSTWKRCWSRS